MTTATQNVEQLSGELRRASRSGRRRMPAWLREAARRRVRALLRSGFPTTHDEDWRFTNVSAIAQTPFRLAANGRMPPVARRTGAVSAWRARPASWCLWTAALRRELSLLGQRCPQGVKVSESRRSRSPASPKRLKPHLGRYLDIQRDAFCALNTAFSKTARTCTSRRGAVLEEPIHLLFVSTGARCAAR